MYEPRTFKTGVVYFSEPRAYDAEQKEKFYLVLGPSSKHDHRYRWSEEPVEYQYLDLLTGEIGDFHRASYFADRAVAL